MHGDPGSPLFASPVCLPTMSPSSRPRGSPAPKSPLGLGSLPRFHPAVYQTPSAPSNNTSSPSSPRQQRPPHSMRTPSSNSRDALRQYRELIASSSMPRVSAPTISYKPSAPRLDPLGSPGPVTPLALEEEGGYLAAGASTSTSASKTGSDSSPELVDRLIRMESERLASQASSRAENSR